MSNRQIKIPETLDLQKILSDDTRYIECYSMNYVDKHRDKLIHDDCYSGEDALNNQHFEHGTEPDFYDFSVRSENEERDHSFEIEGVLPDDFDRVEKELTVIFKCEAHGV